jgi:hypothetical protein
MAALMRDGGDGEVVCSVQPAPSQIQVSPSVRGWSCQNSIASPPKSSAR